jgi:Holliday junction resolvasome RuvABC endonuclease subunit
MILAIDPGLDGSGWATIQESAAVTDCGVWVAPRKYNWHTRLRMYATYAGIKAKHCEPDVVVLEWPELMQSAGGQVSARSGALVKLSMLVGAIYVRVAPYTTDIVLVTPTRWKGQLSKVTTINRIQRVVSKDVLSKLKPKTHAWDAIGIGLYHNGRF